MSDHLSSLELDEVASGLSAGPPHLASCAECRARVSAVKQQNAALLARPEAKRQREALLPAAPRRSTLRLVAVLVPLAAALALFFVWPRPATPTGDRIKGAPSVVLLDDHGNAVTHARPGQQLTLAVGAPGFKRVAIFTTGTDGGREPLWAGSIEDGPRVQLMQLEVTPGDVEVTAEFDEGPRRTTATTRLQVP